MKTLWGKYPGRKKQKAGEPDSGSWFFRFTAEEDQKLDHALVLYDLMVNMAQAQMLLKMGIYKEEGFQKVAHALKEAYRLWELGKFTLSPDDEDVHTAIEQFLTDKTGQEGARIHTGRSRNDQVLADMRIFMKEAILLISDKWLSIAELLSEKGQAWSGLFFAGLTHTQPAMPHSADAWAASYLDLLLSDFRTLKEAYHLADQSPLGSAAGYGVPYLPVDRAYLARQLGFSQVQTAVAAAQLSRGRIEKQFIDALAYGALTFNRLASDIVLFMHPAFAFIKLSDDQVSGSSIMPQKRNPDVWELIRATYHDLQAAGAHLASLPANLPSGYHRDLQKIKKSVMAAVDVSLSLADAVIHALDGLSFDRESALESLTADVFATHEANKLVSEGIPFREAYQKIAAEVRAKEEEKGQEKTASRRIQKTKNMASSRDYTEELKDAYRHTGAPGSGIPDELKKKSEEFRIWTQKESRKMKKIKDQLFSDDGLTK